MQGLGCVTEMAPHRAQGWPESGTQPLHTAQPQLRMTGSLSSCAQSGLLHKKSARLQRVSLAGTACATTSICQWPWSTAFVPLMPGRVSVRSQDTCMCEAAGEK